MIIYLDKKGNTERIIPEKLFQYSHLQEKFRIVGDFNEVTEFICSFKLPTGETTTLKSMVLEKYEGKNSWVLPIDSSLTYDYGQMKFQFRGTNDGITVATGRGIINILRSSL